ncbi:hypothetical protein BLOT_011094 [Blomia tropicalis]|nr:hypothetical protein BLOT_011094 [Blomia tropicalis]
MILISGYWLRLFMLFCLVQSLIPGDPNDYDDQNKETISNEPQSNKFITKESIQSYFAVKRKEHLDAVQTLLKFQRYEQKFEMMKKIFEKIFETIESSRANVENSNYVIGEELPQKSESIQHILFILDNCAFFGNLVLKLPDISKQLLKLETRWTEQYKWCFSFAINSNIIDKQSSVMFNLAAQQLNLIPRNEDFVNPYEEKTIKQKKLKKANSGTIDTKTKNTQTKKSKGPRMSKVEL